MTSSPASANHFDTIRIPLSWPSRPIFPMRIRLFFFISPPQMKIDPVLRLRLRLRSPFRLLVRVTCKELRDDKRNHLLTIRALNLIWYRAGLVTLTVRLYFLCNYP